MRLGPEKTRAMELLPKILTVTTSALLEVTAHDSRAYGPRMVSTFAPAPNLLVT
jgi:hypothetical protein